MQHFTVAAVAVALLVATAAAAADEQRIELPRHVAAVTAATLQRMRDDTDVLVVAVVQKVGCAACPEVLRQFGAASVAFTTADEAATRFAVLDSIDDAAAADAIVQEFPKLHWAVPAVLVFKKAYQQQGHAPFAFSVSGNEVQHDLPRFVERLVGDDYAVVESEAQLLARIHGKATEGVSIAVFPTADAVSEPLSLVMGNERGHVFFSVVDDEWLAGDAQLLSTYNPKQAAIVAYIATPDRTGGDKHTFEAFSLSVDGLETSSFDEIFNQIKNFVARMKLKRPGHKHDAATDVVVKEVEVPEGGCVRESAEGDAVTLSVSATNVENGNLFAFAKRELFIVGTADGHGDLPDYVMVKGIAGMCAGHRRRLMLPSGYGFAPGSTPPDVAPNDRIRVDIEFLSFGDTTPPKPKFDPDAEGPTDL
jgi:hypothetical protein